MKHITTILTLSLLLGGCVASNLADVISQLGDNPATVCVTVNTVYGTGKALRSNVQNGRVKCDMDGMSVDNSTSGTPGNGSTIQVPVQVPAHNLNLTPVK